MKYVTLSLMAFFSLALAPVLATQGAEGDGATIEFHISTNLPVICVKDDKLDCIAGRLVDRACAIEGLRYRFIDRPWKRAEEEIVEKNGNTFFLVTGKGDGGSNIDWFFLIYSDDVWIYSLNPLDSAALASLGPVGVRRGSPFDRISSQYGSFNLYSFNDWRSGVMMLQAHRLDAVLATRLVIEANVVRSPVLAERQGYHEVLGRMGWYIVRDAKAPQSDAADRFRRGLTAARSEKWFLEMLASHGLEP